MYCPACGKEILSDTKFCPQCGKVLDVSGVNFPSTTSTKKNQQERRTHPTLAVFLIGLMILGLHIFIVGVSANSNSKQEMTGINVVFGFLYFFLFIVFLTTLFRKPKESVTVVDKNTSTSITNLKNQEKNRSGAGKWIIAIIFILALSASFVYLNNSSVNPAVSTAFVIIVLAVLAGLLFRLIKKHREDFLRLFNKLVKTVKFLVHHPKLTIFSLAACIVLALFIYSAFVQGNYKSLERALPGIQDNLAEAATAKLMGDSIIAGRGVSNMWMGKIAKTSQTTSGNLKQLPTSGMLKSYKMAAIDWSDSIAKATANTTTWKALSEDPPVFTLNLNNNKVNEYIETSLQKVALLREAGDVAIKRKDRQAMYYIAGQLLVQEHWLDGIMHSANPGILGLRIKLFSPVLAWFPGPANRKWMCTSRTVAARCGNTNPVDLVGKIRHAAVEYAAAQPGADEQWNQVTTDQLKVPTDQGQYIDAPGGVYNGEPNLPPQLSRAEAAFVDECKARGGTTGGTGGVYSRMPTTQTGIACHHGNGCWDYLTRSSGRYSGGNPGCPEENLLPPPPPPTATPRPPTRAPTRRPAQPTQQPQQPGQPTQPPNNPQNPPSASWDGVYSIRQSGSCGTSELGTIFSGIFSDTITVRNNRVSVPNWGSATISSSGEAQLSYNMSYSGVNVSGRQTFHFYNSGGRPAVQGTMNISTVGVGCQINFSGSRN